MNNMEIPENILIILEIRAKKTGKPLNEVIEEYKQSLERGRKFVEIAKKISQLKGENIDDIIKEACDLAGVKIPKYQSIKAQYDYKRIKENDTLIFNMDYTELNDGDIYLFNSKVLDREFLLYGEYDREIDGFILGVEKTILKNNSDIEVLGVLTKVERDL